jgi:hypothetical protein
MKGKSLNFNVCECVCLSLLVVFSQIFFLKKEKKDEIKKDGYLDFTSTFVN